MQKEIALITGVSRIKGIGFAIALALAKKGIDIFFTHWSIYDSTMPWGSSPEDIDHITKQISSYGVKCHHVSFDLSQSENIPSLFAEVKLSIGMPTILINNATHSTHSNIETITSTILDDHYSTNLRGTTLLISGFKQNFNGTKGRIINITSGQSLGPMPNEIAYAITKAGIETLTTTIASQLAKDNITINAVNPGPNDTGWMTPETEEQLKQHFPTNRIGQPSDTANLVSFLVSEEAQWITGQIIHSEGGFNRSI